MTDEMIANKVAEKAEEYYKKLQKDKNSRERSWEHCYKIFHDARSKDYLEEKDYDYLTIHLAFYLASWGMYRGSSFLLDKDYIIHRPVVEEIMKKKYDCLLDIDCKDMEKNYAVLDELYLSIGEHYKTLRNDCRNSEIKNDISSTLRTKILLGTLGCVPAYDQSFTEAIRKNKVASGVYGKKSIFKLALFYKNNYELFEKKRSDIKIGDLIYPQMKFLDMAFWSMG